MSTFALTADGDLDLSSRILVLETAPADVVVTTFRKEVLLYKGSYFLDQRSGMPWLQDILGQKPKSLSAVSAIFRRKALAISGVVEAVVDLAYESETRALTVSCDMHLEDGSFAEAQATL